MLHSSQRQSGTGGFGFTRRRVVFGDDAADGGENFLHRRFLRRLFRHGGRLNENESVGAA